MYKVDIKPMSVNKAWRGRRYKTKEYKGWEKEMLLKLPKVKVPEGKLKVVLEFGFKSKLSDIDNPTKLCIDLMQKKYGFNDRMIYELNITKAVGQGEYVKFDIVGI